MMNKGNRNDDAVARFLKRGRQEIADNGFTERVMSRLPQQQCESNLALWLTPVCCLIGLVLFVKLGGIGQLIGLVCNLAASDTVQTLLTTSLPQLVLGICLLGGIIIHQVYTEFK